MLKAQLEAYRRKKCKINEKIMIDSKHSDSECEKVALTAVQTNSEEHRSNPNLRLQNSNIPDTIKNNEDDYLEERTVYNYVVYILYFFFWVCLYAIAIEIEFGAVYFILSSFVIMWINTQSRPKKRGEPSAYSVFNPNCEAIDGTLDASQFESEIRYGMPAMY